MDYLMENWLVIITTTISVASVIAKVTPNQADDKFIYMAQRVVDTLAMSSTPTEKTTIEE